MDVFTGWPVEAPALLAEIAADNRADRWPELRERHAALVRGPTLALAAELAGEFGPVRVFRPHVTRRFRPDAPPLRTDTGGVARLPGGCELAVLLSVDALTVTAGLWRFDRDQRVRYRSAIDAEESGEELAGLLRRLAAEGFPADPEGELHTTPRGWGADHARVWLARRRGLQVVRRWELGPWLSTTEPLERVRAAWRAAAPLVGWLHHHVGPATAAQPDAAAASSADPAGDTAASPPAASAPPAPGAPAPTSVPQAAEPPAPTSVPQAAEPPAPTSATGAASAEPGHAAVSRST